MNDSFGCLCSYCGLWHSSIYYDKAGKSICIECKNKSLIKRRRKLLQLNSKDSLSKDLN